MNKYWEYSDVNGTPHLVMYAWSGLLLLISTGSMLMEDRHTAKNVRITTGILILLSAALLDYIILWGRYIFLGTRTDEYSANMTPNGGIFYSGPLYFSATEQTLKNNECPVSKIYYNGTDPTLYHHSASSQSCKLIYTYNVNLFDGAAYLSLFIGLVIYALFQYFITTVEINQMVDNERQRAETEIDNNTAAIAANGGEPLTLFQKVLAYFDATYDAIVHHPRDTLRAFVKSSSNKLTKYVFTLTLLSQQALVLLPLTAISANDFCLVVNVPTSVLHAVCLYKYAVWAIPILLIHIPIGLLAYGVARGETGEGWAGVLVKCLFILAFVYCFIVTLVYAVYYLFAGFALGVWFELSQWNFTRRILVPQFLSIGLFFYNDFLNSISDHNAMNTGGYEAPANFQNAVDGGIEMPSRA